MKILSLSHTDTGYVDLRERILLELEELTNFISLKMLLEQRKSVLASVSVLKNVEKMLS